MRKPLFYEGNRKVLASPTPMKKFMKSKGISKGLAQSLVDEMDMPITIQNHMCILSVVCDMATSR